MIHFWCHLLSRSIKCISKTCPKDQIKCKDPRSNNFRIQGAVHKILPSSMPRIWRSSRTLSQIGRFIRESQAMWQTPYNKKSQSRNHNFLTSHSFRQIKFPKNRKNSSPTNLVPHRNHIHMQTQTNFKANPPTNNWIDIQVKILITKTTCQSTILANPINSNNLISIKSIIYLSNNCIHQLKIKWIMVGRTKSKRVTTIIR